MTIEQLLNAGGGEIAVTLDASAAVGDLAAVHNGTGLPIKFLGRKTLPGNSTDYYTFTHSVELVGGRKVVLYLNINAYPCFRIYGPGMDELVSETVVSASPAYSANMALVAMSNGNFAVFFVGQSDAYPYFAIFDPAGAVVKAVTQIEAVAWNQSQSGIKACQLTGGNLVFAGLIATFEVRATIRSEDGNTVVLAPATLTAATDQTQWDIVASKNGQNTWGLVRREAGVGIFSAFSALGVSLGASTSLTCDYVAIAASDDGYFWRAFAKSAVTATIDMGRHDPQAPGTYLALDVIANTGNSWSQVALACTSGNLCVVVTSGGAGGVFNIGIIGKMGTYAGLYAHQKMTKYSWPTDAAMVAAATQITTQTVGYGSIFAATTPAGDVVVGCGLNDTSASYGSHYGTIYLWKIDRSGYVLPRSMQLSGYMSAQASTHRKSVVPTKNVLLICLANRQQPTFYVAPLVPIVGAVASAGHIKQSGKYTTPSGDWPKGQNLKDLPALCGHVVDAAFISGTDYILGS